MRKRAIALCVAGLLVFAGCGSDGDGTDASAEPSASVSASSTQPPLPCSLEDGSTKRVAVESEQPVALLSDVRPNAEGCPRVVFEFTDHVPGYTVGYAEPPITDCGSGEEQPVDTWDADAYLTVSLVPAASADMNSGEELKMTYTGPRDFDIDGDVLKHLAKTCDYEAEIAWVIALDAEHDFKVDTFEDPARLVIDISGS